MNEDSRLWEFLEDDTTRLRSMNRLATFVAVVALAIILFSIIGLAAFHHGNDLREYLGALTTVAIIIAGLGGFNYAAGRAAGAYTEVRVKQAENGLQPASPPPLLGPTTTINVGPSKTETAKDVAIEAKGDVTVTPKPRRKR